MKDKATAFLQYMPEGVAMSRNALVEASGEDAATVNNRLQSLKGRGLVYRTADGWALTDKGTQPATESNPALNSPPATEPDSDAEGPLFSFFLDEDFDVQIARRDGTGEAAILPRLEALRLRDFLNQFGDVMRGT